MLKTQYEDKDKYLTKQEMFLNICWWSLNTNPWFTVFDSEYFDPSSFRDCQWQKTRQEPILDSGSYLLGTLQGTYQILLSLDKLHF